MDEYSALGEKRQDDVPCRSGRFDSGDSLLRAAESDSITLANMDPWQTLDPELRRLIRRHLAALNAQVDAWLDDPNCGRIGQI